MAGTNRYLAEVYRPAFNAKFAIEAEVLGSASMPWRAGEGLNGSVRDVRFERTIGRDNWVQRHRDGTLSICHGFRRPAHYQANCNYNGGSRPDSSVNSFRSL
jgi:hypothetical protein